MLRFAYTRFWRQSANDPFVDVCRCFYCTGVRSLHERFTDDVDSELFRREDVLASVFRATFAQNERNAQQRRVMRNLRDEKVH